MENVNEMKEYVIYTASAGRFVFTGKHLKDRETNNWHYYITIEGEILHFRKDHMICVSERSSKSN